MRNRIQTTWSGKITTNLFLRQIKFIYLHLPLWWRFHPRKGTYLHCSWEEKQLTNILTFNMRSFLLAVFFSAVGVSNRYHCYPHPHLFTYSRSSHEMLQENFQNWNFCQDIKPWLYFPWPTRNLPCITSKTNTNQENIDNKSSPPRFVMLAICVRFSHFTSEISNYIYIILSSLAGKYWF